MKRIVLLLTALILACYISCESDSEETPKLELSVSGTSATKAGATDGTINLTITGGVAPFTILWSNGMTTEDLNGLAAGDYTVTVTDSKKQVSTISFKVTEPAADEIVINVTSKDVKINGESTGEIDITVTGGVPPFSYSWSNGSKTEDVTGLKAGEYEIIVTDSRNSTKSAKTTIAEPTKLEIQATVGKIAYYGHKVVIKITVSGGAEPYNILWSNGKSSKMITDLSAGEYSVVVTDANGSKIEEKYEITDLPKLFETIEFNSTDGLLVTADLYHVSDDAPVILLCHQADYSRGEYRYTAARLFELGYNCMATDQRSGNNCNYVNNETFKRANQQNLGTAYKDAEPDIIAAIDYLYNKYNKKIILVGSSYSSSLALKIASTNEKLQAVLSFSPASTLVVTDDIFNAAKNITIPVFLTSSKSEASGIKRIYDGLITEKKVHFTPNDEGIHGASALSFSGKDEYWTAFLEFLKSL